MTALHRSKFLPRVKLVAWMQIILLASPLMFYPNYARAECPACNGYFAAANKCKGTPDATECEKTAFDAKWGQLAQQCMATKVNDKGKDSEMITAIVYTAAAAVCWTGCFTEWMGGATMAACYAAGGIAMATDLGMSIAAGNTMSGLMTAAGAGVAGAAGSAIGGAGAGGLTTSVNGMGEACGVAAVATIMAGIKWFMMSSSDGNSKDACANAGLFVKGQGTPNSIRAPGLKASSEIVASGSNSTSAPKTSTDFASEADQALVSSATADPLMTILPNRGQIPDALKKMGVSLEDIAKGLEDNSPSNLLAAGLSNAPAGFGDALRKVDEDIKSGKIQLNGGGGGSYSGGGKGSGGSSGGNQGAGSGFDFNAAFGGKKDEQSGSSLIFGRKMSSLDSSDDIWHSTYTGTIFQIISTRLEKNRSKVQTLEWTTPLNRAFMGLSAKPKN